MSGSSVALSATRTRGRGGPNFYGTHDSILDKACTGPAVPSTIPNAVTIPTTAVSLVTHASLLSLRSRPARLRWRALLSTLRSL